MKRIPRPILYLHLPHYQNRMFQNMMVGSHSQLLVSNVEPPVGELRVYSKHQKSKTIVQFLSQTSTTDSSNPMLILL